MNIEFQNKLTNELKNAFIYFGWTDEEYLNEKVSQTIDELKCLQAGTVPETIHTDVGDKTGHLIDIVISFNESTQKMHVVQMLVSEDKFEYILNAYTSNKKPGWQYGDPIDVTDETYTAIELKSVSPESFIC